MIRWTAALIAALRDAAKAATLRQVIDSAAGMLDEGMLELGDYDLQSVHQVHRVLRGGAPPRFTPWDSGPAGYEIACLGEEIAAAHIALDRLGVRRTSTPAEDADEGEPGEPRPLMLSERIAALGGGR